MVFFSDEELAKKGRYQIYMWILTFLIYTTFHLSRKPYSIVKASLEGGTDNPGWSPFNEKGSGFENGSTLLGSLDSIYLSAYAVGMFFAGALGDRLNLRWFLPLGLFCSSVFLAMWGVGFYLGIHSFYYYAALNFGGGMFQSTGWPCVVTLMGRWFGESKRGLIMGIWNAHTSVGNILGSVVATASLSFPSSDGLVPGHDWPWAFFVPTIICVVMSFVTAAFLVNHPHDIGLPDADEEAEALQAIMGVLASDEHPHEADLLEQGTGETSFTRVEVETFSPDFNGVVRQQQHQMEENFIRPDGGCHHGTVTGNAFTVTNAVDASGDEDHPWASASMAIPVTTIKGTSPAKSHASMFPSPWGKNLTPIKTDAAQPQPVMIVDSPTISVLGSPNLTDSCSPPPVIFASSPLFGGSALTGMKYGTTVRVEEGFKEKAPYYNIYGQDYSRNMSVIGSAIGSPEPSPTASFSSECQPTTVTTTTTTTTVMTVTGVAVKKRRTGQRKAITFCQALCIPGVLEFAMGLFFAKLVAYSFLFWLPLYLSTVGYSQSKAGYLSTVFDVGGILGGILAGYFTDRFRKPATVCVLWLALTVPGLFVYRHFTAQYVSEGTNVAMMFLLGACVNAPYALITTAVSADLGSHPQLGKDATALATVTGILDGTGSMGAAIQGILIGFISADNWDLVFGILMGCCFLSMLSLYRLFLRENRWLSCTRCCFTVSSKTASISGRAFAKLESEGEGDAGIRSSTDYVDEYLDLEKEKKRPNRQKHLQDIGAYESVKMDGEHRDSIGDQVLIPPLMENADL